MSNFDEWFKDYHNKHEAYAETISSDAYKAGAESRQAEVNSLKIELNGANERAMMTLNHKNKMVDKMQAEIDELKVMIRKLVDNTIIGFDDELENQANDLLKGESK